MVQAGFYECDITPPFYSEVPGGFTKRRVSKVCDPLKVRAAAFSDGKEKVVLMGIDTLGVGPLFLQRLRDSLPGIKLITSASHTHFGGMLRDKMPGIDEAPAPFRKYFLEKKPAFDPFYYEFAMQQCISAATYALNALEEVDFSFGKGQVKDLIFNRRIRMKDGSVVTHPGKCNPEAVDYAGPVDDELGVMGVWKKDSDELLGFVLNFSCHACINLEGVTADFPGVALETVKAVYGKEAGGVYINGGSGDVTQIDNLSLVKDMGRPLIYKVGRAVGGEAVKLLATAPKGPIHTMAFLEEDYIVTPRNAPVSPEKAAEAGKIVEKGEEGPEFEKACSILAAYLRRDERPELQMKLAVFQLGPLVIGSTPCEMFAQFALDFKGASHFPFTWFSQLSFIQSYIPTKDAFDPVTGGGYEAAFAQFVPETGDEMVKIITDLAGELTPEEAPQPEMVPPSNRVWEANCRENGKKKN